MCSVRAHREDVVVRDVDPNRSVGANLKEEITRLHSQGSTIANLEERHENVEKSIDKLGSSVDEESIDEKMSIDGSRHLDFDDDGL
ncbi:hypothetical protein Syun_021664 [Stephania yunnanensis]|uniref:Uncharacterized protein n=1 Tax=Stephania yunnanensis TaxID=152371 RepID=A0AAP0IGE8_9MAGN